MSKIAIRADGGNGIGIGHVMRCLSLAKAFQKNDHEVYFFSKLDVGIEVIEDQGFSVVKLADLAIEDEVAIVNKLVSEYKIDIVIVDSYHVSEDYLISLRRHVDKLVYIDDENKFNISADVVINGNLTAEYLGYREYDDAQQLLLGTKYNLIRGEFGQIPERIIKENVESIMITTGGSDSFNLTKTLLEILLKAETFNHLEINVLVGSGFSNVEELIGLSKVYTRVRLFSNQSVNQYNEIIYSSVADLMCSCDAAIAAGGSTLYELAACGTPTLAFILAENQQFLVEKMSERGYVMNLGWYHELTERVVTETLQLLMNDYEKRIKMSRKGQKLVDTNGAERIVQELV